MTPGLWQPSVHSEVVFDPSILSLSILASLEFEVALSMLCLLASKRLLYLYQHAGIADMESSSAAFPETPSIVSFSSTEHHRWIFMFAAESPFNIASRVGQDKIHVESIPLGSGRFRLRIRKGERFPSTELEFTNRTTLEIRDGHGKALTVMAFTIPSGPTSGENDLRIELTIEKPAAPSPHTVAQGQGQGAKEEQDSPDSSSSSEAPKSTDSDDSDGMMSP
ncbi:hypothetical protein K457DRAFT_25231 [Linnemannia elongata AG-77]|uniref:Uncharacterized protein n=1 Tax=Linnemannia elongata AG-77 TaxID=1314771 RepID=A0A197JDV1_9FUNG|nr:hypothetical protein K457DRAFT_25231 [Linnemannia elongata AG-77]